MKIWSAKIGSTRGKKMARCNHKCEVYSRIVGYYRPVSDWNLGKKEEFGDRKTYNVGDSPGPTRFKEKSPQITPITQIESAESANPSTSLRTGSVDKKRRSSLSPLPRGKHDPAAIRKLRAKAKTGK